MIANGQVHVLVVMAVFHVLEKAPDDGGGNHVAHILGHVAAVTLEGDAHDFSVLQDGSAAVTGIDRRVDLDGEVRIHSRVRVRLEIHPRDDTPRDREAVAADGIAKHGNGGFDGGDATEVQRGGALEEIRIVHRQEGEVAIVGHMQDAGGIGLRVAFLGNG